MDGFCLLRHDLDEDPHVLKLQELLELSDVDLLIGKLRRLWRYGDLHTADGMIPFATEASLDALVKFPGFSKALCEVGWLEITPQGAQIVRFSEWTSLDAKREALKKLPKVKPKKVASPYRPELAELPLLLSTPEFRIAWGNWCEHRRKIKKPLTAMAVQRQMVLLGALSIARAIATIEMSIQQGWIGLFPTSQEKSHAARGGVGQPGRPGAPRGKYDHLTPRETSATPEARPAQALLPPQQGQVAGPGA